MCLTFPGKERKRGTHINFFGGIFGVKSGAGSPNGPFSATKSLVYCFFPALIFQFSKCFCSRGQHEMNRWGLKSEFAGTLLDPTTIFRNHYIFNSKTISLCYCKFRKIIPMTIFYVTVPNCNCKDIFPSNPQSCNCNGN